MSVFNAILICTLTPTALVCNPPEVLISSTYTLLPRDAVRTKPMGPEEIEQVIVADEPREQVKLDSSDADQRCTLKTRFVMVRLKCKI